jgi:putative hydrolase of the HAD superfamily
MDIKAIAFDVNGTLIDIVTEDDMEAAFRAIGHFLTYQGIDLRRHQVRDLYFQTMKQQQRQSSEQYPEFDAVGVWRTIVTEHLTDFSRTLPTEQLAQLPQFLAEMYRGITRRRLKLYPHVLDVLNALRSRCRLAVVTDGQSSYARGELHKVGLIEYFDPIVVSGDHGFRKPDRRLFQFALDGMGIAAENAIYIGNDMHRDIFGARETGMRTIMFHSAHGAKEHDGCVPDYVAADWRDVLQIVEKRFAEHR